MPRADHPLSFVESFAKSVEAGYNQVGPRAFVPTYFLITTFLPTVLVVGGRQFGQNVSVETLVLILTAIMTVEGILAAVSVSAMVQVQQIVCEYPFSDYLEEEHVFDAFIFIPQFTFVVQCGSAVVCVASIVLVQFVHGYELSILVICSGIFLYTMVRTLGLVDLIRVLSWHYSRFQIALEQAKAADQKR